MDREQIYVQKTLEHLESCIVSWMAMRENSLSKKRELATMLRDLLLKRAEKLAVKYDIGK